MMKFIRFILLSQIIILTIACSQAPRNIGFWPVSPLKGAHAHNDYEHPQALLFALSHGFTSIEADVHLVDGKLLVAHDQEDARPAKSLENLYLRPLWKRFNEHIVRGKLLLLIDIKSDADSTFYQLQNTLSRYRAMLKKWDDPSQNLTRPVQILASGNRSLDLVRQSKPRFIAYDGRLPDLGVLTDSTLVPLISDKWTDHFSWNGQGNIPKHELVKLQNIVHQAHEYGQMIRFWGTLDSAGVARTKLWQILHNNDVDMINTDDLMGLRQFLLEHDDN